MSDPIVYGFPYSTFVHIVRLILTHKDVPYTFRDLETEMGKPSHLALHPFNRVPILQHGDFVLYETSAIVAYLDETFPRLPLQPRDIPGRARMDQWISSVNSYYYTYMIYHVTHERLVFPRLGIASDEKVVAHALPKVEVGLQVLERQLSHGKNYVLGADLSLADFYLVPCTFSFSLTEEGKAMYPKYPAFCRWRETMEALPSVQQFRASLAAARVPSSMRGNGPCHIGRNTEQGGTMSGTPIVLLSGRDLQRASSARRRQSPHSAKPMPLSPTIVATRAAPSASAVEGGSIHVKSGLLPGSHLAFASKVNVNLPDNTKLRGPSHDPGRRRGL